MGASAGEHHWILGFCLLHLGLTVCSATARDLSDDGGRSGMLYPDKPPVMTIKTEHGDLVDCVDFYSQPAFGHPALKNHILQMETSSSPDQVPARILMNTEEDKANWTRSSSGSGIRCPLGTVPILSLPYNSAITTKYDQSGPYDIHEVYPSLHAGDNGTRLFTYWTDPPTGRWYLQYDDTIIGYWPKELFTTLADGYSNRLVWGGEVTRPPTMPRQATQMGSGHFPSEGRDGISSSLKNISCIDTSGNLVQPTAPRQLVTRKGCFDLEIVGSTSTDGYVIYFGGPGKSETCP